MIISQEVVFAAFALFENAAIVILSLGVGSNEGRERKPLFSFAPKSLGLPWPVGDGVETERNLVRSCNAVRPDYCCLEGGGVWNLTFW